MQISLKPCKDLTTVNTDCLILVTDAALNSELAQAVDAASGGVISHMLKRGDFKAKLAETLSLIDISDPTRPLYISYAFFCYKKNKLH